MGICLLGEKSCLNKDRKRTSRCRLMPRCVTHLSTSKDGVNVLGQQLLVPCLLRAFILLHGSRTAWRQSLLLKTTREGCLTNVQKPFHIIHPAQHS